jgi:hypothetical protein
MKNLLQEKRVFKQESFEHDRFLVFNKEYISAYYYFFNVIGVKNGDLLNPSKWVTLKESTILPSDSFHLEDFEYLFHPDKWLVQDLQQTICNTLNIVLDKDLSNFLKLETIPSELAPKIRQTLTKEAYTEKDLSIVEAYKHPETSKYIVLNTELTDDDISYEYTENFLKLDTLSIFKKESESSSEYLIKTIPKDSPGMHHEQWYLFKKNADDISSITQIDEIEEIIPYTNFKTVENH